MPSMPSVERLQDSSIRSNTDTLTRCDWLFSVYQPTCHVWLLFMFHQNNINKSYYLFCTTRCGYLASVKFTHLWFCYHLSTLAAAVNFWDWVGFFKKPQKHWKNKTSHKSVLPQREYLAAVWSHIRNKQLWAGM